MLYRVMPKNAFSIPKLVRKVIHFDCHKILHALLHSEARLLHKGDNVEDMTEGLYELGESR